MKKALKILAAGVVGFAITLIFVSVLAILILANLVPVGDVCHRINVPAFLTPLCSEIDAPGAAYLFAVGGVVAGIVLLRVASGAKGLAVVITLCIATLSGAVYLAVPLDRDFLGADYVRSATYAVTDSLNQRSPTVTPMGSLADKSVTMPVQQRPTAMPTRRFASRSAWRPPTPQELATLKKLMLELTNEERARHGAQPVKLGNNQSPQTHAEQALVNCYSSHWDMWGMKPLYRYTLAGGDQYTAENVSGIDYCPKTSDNFRVNWQEHWENDVRETVAGWIDSPGHHRNLVDHRHTVMHAGIAIGKYGNSNMVQVFSGDYVTWTEKPGISDATLTATGRIYNAFWDKNGNYAMAGISYHPPTHLLSPGQLAGTYCLEPDIYVGSLSAPLKEREYYIDRETGRQYTDYTTYTRNNKQCVNPYELRPDRPAPSSWDAANVQYRAAVELSQVMPREESVVYSVVSEQLDISPEGNQFAIRADLSPILSHYGPGIYTLTIWATTPSGKFNPVAQYPIWWHTEPTMGHPY